MRIAVLVTLAAVLGLAACNREEAADPAMEADASADAMGADGSSSGSGGAMSTGPSDMAAPATEPMAGTSATGSEPVDQMQGGVSDATRAGAKEKAEQTNLHPAG